MPEELGRMGVKQLGESPPAVELRGVTRYFPTVPYSFTPDSFNWIHSLMAIRRADLSPHFPALDNVSLRVENGEFFGILGPNGAGKTTLMKILCGSLYPSQGRVDVAGHDISREPELVQQRIAIVIGYSQSDMWGSRLTALENLSFYCRLQGVPRNEAEQRSRDALQVVGLVGKMGVRVGTFSGGMYQRLSIARGLVRDADVWLMDEPTIRLDPLGAREIREFIKKKLNREQGKTVLFATHYLEEARDLCDRVAVLHKGRIVAQGPPADLLRSTFGSAQEASLSIKGLTAEAIPRLDRLRGIVGVRDLGPTVTGVRRIQVRWREASAATILALHEHIESEGGRIVDFSLDEPGMEDLFLHLTGEPETQGTIVPSGQTGN